ncbi:hypothetical protein [Nonomuraea sp. NPDC049725]|uniref:hypothetical protein n=1 Tax=Nonomuraea sp. NPDC049725 TaxID=3154508 RepID=UPI0034201D63
MRTVGKAAVVVSALATAVALAPVAQAQAAPAFVAYHGATPSQQTANFTKLRDQGYHPVTVNVSEGPRYAAVWQKGSSPGWLMYQGMSASGLQSRFDAALAKGYQPISISGTGSGSDAVFAAVFEKRSGKFFARHGLDDAQFAAANRKAADDGYVLSSVDVYGTAGDRRYVAVWTVNPGGSWYFSYGKSAAAHRAEFDKRVGAGYRPTSVAVGPDGTYAAAWRKDGLKSWAHYIGMTASGYQSRFDQLNAKGLYPVQVNAENGVYTAVWVKN